MKQKPTEGEKIFANECGAQYQESILKHSQDPRKNIY